MHSKADQTHSGQAAEATGKVERSSRRRVVYDGFEPDPTSDQSGNPQSLADSFDTGTFVDRLEGYPTSTND